MESWTRRARGALTRSLAAVGGGLEGRLFAPGAPPGGGGGGGGPGPPKPGIGGGGGGGGGGILLFSGLGERTKCPFILSLVDPGL